MEPTAITPVQPKSYPTSQQVQQSLRLGRQCNKEPVHHASRSRIRALSRGSAARTPRSQLSRPAPHNSSGSACPVSEPCSSQRTSVRASVRTLAESPSPRRRDAYCVNERPWGLLSRPAIAILTSATQAFTMRYCAQRRREGGVRNAVKSINPTPCAVRD